MNMQRAFSIGIAALILLPQAALAAESAIVITNDVNSSTGGVYAGSGQVVTTGNSSESVEIRTATNSGGVQGIVDTNVNGIHHEEPFSSTSTGGVSIDIATTSPAGSIEMHIQAKSGKGVHARTASSSPRLYRSATAEVDTGLGLSGKSSEPLFRISDLFRHFFDIFRFVF